MQKGVFADVTFKLDTCFITRIINGAPRLFLNMTERNKKRDLKKTSARTKATGWRISDIACLVLNVLLLCRSLIGGAKVA